MSEGLTSTDPELIEVRPDEQLDISRLEPYLRANLPRAEGAFELAQFGGGKANLTYLVRFGEDEYVLRRPPLGPIARSAHDMRREHRVLSVLNSSFPLAPRSFLLCTNTAILGVDFHVMERRHGLVIRGDMPPEYNQPATCRRVGEMMIDTLASFHLIDPAAAGLADLGRPEGYIERQLEGWIGRWQAAKYREHEFADELIAWLRARLPRSRNTTLLHNDYHIANLLLAKGDPGRVAAVLDWDMCTRGDPIMDLGYLLAYWVEAGDDPAWREGAIMPTWHPGFPSRAETAKRYAKLTGFDLGELHWYVVENLFRTIAVLGQIYIRYLRGQTKDERFASLGSRIEWIFARAQASITSGTI